MTQRNEKVASQLEQIVVARINGDRLITPSPARATRRYEEIARERNVSARDLAAALAADPMLAARLLHSAEGEPESLEPLIGKLGVSRVMSMLAEQARPAMANSRDLTIQHAADEIWQHSLVVARIARDLATLSGTIDGEAAYLAGLLHDLGKLAVTTILLEAERLMTSQFDMRWLDRNSWMDVLRRVYPAVSRTFSERWALNDQIRSLLVEGGDYDVINRNSVSNVVRFANAIAESEGLPGGPANAEAKALVMVGRSLLGIEEEMVERLAREVKSKEVS